MRIELSTVSGTGSVETELCRMELDTKNKAKLLIRMPVHGHKSLYNSGVLLYIFLAGKDAIVECYGVPSSCLDLFPCPPASRFTRAAQHSEDFPDLLRACIYLELSECFGKYDLFFHISVVTMQCSGHKGSYTSSLNKSTILISDVNLVHSNVLCSGPRTSMSPNPKAASVKIICKVHGCCVTGLYRARASNSSQFYISHFSYAATRLPFHFFHAGEFHWGTLKGEYSALDTARLLRGILKPMVLPYSQRKVKDRKCLLTVAHFHL